MVQMNYVFKYYLLGKKALLEQLFPEIGELSNAEMWAFYDDIGYKAHGLYRNVCLLLEEYI